MDNKELGENRFEKGMSVVKYLTSISALISGNGWIASVSSSLELLEKLMPNQRIDKIVKLLEDLTSIASSLEISFENMLLKMEKQTAYFSLLEHGLFNAYRASSDERLEYIASIIINGLTKEEIEISRYIYLLNILSELNDEEIIWLRFYLEPTLGCDKEFREKHINVLERPRTFIGAPEENLNKAALQDSYLEHLDRLGLIESKIQIDKNTNLPIFNKSGKPEVSSRHTTRLGKMLLKEIGLLDEQ